MKKLSALLIAALLSVNLAWADSAGGYSTAQSPTYALGQPLTPVIASGFGTTPVLTPVNGTSSFKVNVGTGGTATAGIVTMPAALNGVGYFCTAVNNSATIQAAAIMYVTPTSTTSITISNYTLTTGVLLAWTASTVVDVTCTD